MERFASFDRGIASASPSASRATGVLLLGHIEGCDWDRIFPGRCFIVMFGSGRFEGSDAEGTGVFSISTGSPPSSTNSIASGSLGGKQGGKLHVVRGRQRTRRR